MDQIPAEILQQHVFLFLDDKVKRQARVVCTKWADLINYSEFKLRFTREETLPVIIERFKQYTKPIGLTFHKNVFLGERKLLEHICQLSNLTLLKLLNLVDDSTVQDWIKISHLTNLKVFESEAPLPVQISKIIPNPAVTTDGEEFQIELMKSSRMEDLTVYSINIPEEPQITKSCLDFVLHHTNLTKLVLETVSSNPSLDRFTNLRFLEIKDAVAGFDSRHTAPIQFNKLPALERLKIYAKKIDPDLHNNTTLTSLQIRTAKVKEQLFRSIAALTNLRVLTVQEENEGRTCYSPNFLSYLSLPNLEKLTVAVDAEGDGFSKMQINPAKLTRLKLRFNSGFDVNTITHLSGLQDIELIESIDEDLVEQDFKFLEKFSQLTRLTVASSAPVARKFSFFGLNTLQDVQLDAFDWDPAELRLLTNLHTLVLGGTIHEVTATYAFTELTKMTQLKFKLSGKNFKPRSYKIFAKLPNLEILDLCGTYIDQTWMDEILKITTLTSLAVKHVVNEENFKSMTVLSNLAALYLGNCKHGCKDLSYLTNLQCISVGWLEQQEKTDLEASLKNTMTRLYELQLLTEEDREDFPEYSDSEEDLEEAIMADLMDIDEADTARLKNWMT